MYKRQLHSVCRSKAAEISITKSLARVLAPEVRVIGVAPGIVLTRWVEGRTGHIDKLAGETPLQKVAVQMCIRDSYMSKMYPYRRY